MAHILCNDSIKVQRGSLQEREKIFWELQAELRNVKYFTWSKSFILKKWSITTNLAPEGYFQRANAEFISYSAGFKTKLHISRFYPQNYMILQKWMFSHAFCTGFLFFTPIHVCHFRDIFQLWLQI